MKPYFENDDPKWMSIVPFDKVVIVRAISKERILVFDVTSENNGTEFPIEQLADYKAWLDMQQKALINQAYEMELICQPSLTTHNINSKPALRMINEMQIYKKSDGTEIPEIKWLICCWESVYGRKFESLTVDEIEDFLHDCLGILDYAGALNNKNRGTLNDKKPEITEKLLTFLYENSKGDPRCYLCKNEGTSYYCHGDKECEFVFDADAIAELNKKWQES